MAKKSDGKRTEKGTFKPGVSGNPSGLAKKTDSVDGIPQVKQVRTDGWANFFTSHGVFGADKRIGTSFNADVLSFDQMQQLARGDDLAKRAGETLPKEAFRQGWDLVIAEGEGDEDEGDRVQEVYDKLEVLGAKSYIKQALVYERFYGGAAVLLGVNDGQADLTKPLNLAKVRSIDWLTPLEARELMPVYGYSDPRAPKYGQPEIYRLVTRAVLPSHDGKYYPVTTDIHESRLLVFPGSRVSRYQISSMQGGWGDSILVPMYRVLRDFNMSWASAGALVADFAQAVYKMENLWETLAGDDAGAFQARLQSMELTRSTINATVIDKNDDFIRQSTPITGLPDLLDKFATRLAAAADMPLTLLFGTSPGGLNSTGESDIRFFYDRVAEYQEERVLPQLKKLVQIIMLCTGIKQEPKKWSIRFRPLWQESAKDKASAMLTQAQADVAWIGAGVFSAEECSSAHWSSGEYNPDITIDFHAREKQEQAVAAPVNQKDLNALDPDHPDFKGSRLDPGHNAYVPPPSDPDEPDTETAPTNPIQTSDAYAEARGWRKRARTRTRLNPPTTKKYTPPPSDPDAPDPETSPTPNVITADVLKTDDDDDGVHVDGDGHFDIEKLDEDSPAYAVRKQLEDDYPPEAMMWIADAEWSGPMKVALSRIDFSNQALWTASRPEDKDHVKKFVKKIKNGWEKPVILVNRPGTNKYMIIDGHHRCLAYQILGRSVMAYVAKTKGVRGPWDDFHSAQRMDAAPFQLRMDAWDESAHSRDESGKFSEVASAGGRIAPSAVVRGMQVAGPWFTEKDPTRSGEKRAQGLAKAKAVAARQAGKKAAAEGRAAEKVAAAGAAKNRLAALYEAHARVQKEKEAAEASAVRRQNDPGSLDPKIHAERLANMQAEAERERWKAEHSGEPMVKLANTLPGQAKLQGEGLEPGQVNFGKAERELEKARIGENVRSHEPSALAKKMIGAELAKNLKTPAPIKVAVVPNHFGGGRDVHQSEPQVKSTLGIDKNATPHPDNPTGDWKKAIDGNAKATDSEREAFGDRKIISGKTDSRGSQGSWNVALDDNTRAKWKPASGERDVERGGVKVGEGYLREAAFSALAKDLGVSDMSPASVVHTHEDGNGRSVGALQAYLSGTPGDFSNNVMEREPAERMRVADWITGNSDRHAGNVLLNTLPDGRVMPTLIDHGFTMPSLQHDVRFIQPWKSIPHDEGALLPSTLSHISKLEPLDIARTLTKAGIDKESVRWTVMRTMHIQEHPELLEVKSSRPQGSFHWDDVLANAPIEKEQGQKAKALMKRI